LVGGVLAVAVTSLFATGFFDAQRFAESGPAIKQLAYEMFPPDLGRRSSWLRPLLDTFAMSIAGTALAIVLSAPLSLLGVPITSPHPLVFVAAR